MNQAWRPKHTFLLRLAAITGLGLAGCSLFQKNTQDPPRPDKTASEPTQKSNAPSAESDDAATDPTSQRIAEYIREFDARETASTKPATTTTDRETAMRQNPTSPDVSVSHRNESHVAQTSASRPVQLQAEKVKPEASTNAQAAAPPTPVEGIDPVARDSVVDERTSSEDSHAPLLASPRLSSISVRAAPYNSDSDTPARRLSANGASRVETSDGRDKNVDALERAITADPNDLESQFRLRLHYLSCGQDARAAATTPGMTQENEQIVLGMIRALQAARSKSGRDPAAWANRQLAALDELRAVVRQQADLRVARVTLCRSVSSFGVYEEYRPAEFPAGRASPAIVYVEAANFRGERTATGEHRTRLGVRLAILDRGGQEVWARQEDQIEDVSRNPREDFFVPIEIEIPGVLNPGEYTLKAGVTDLIGQKSNENQAAFRIVVR